MDTVFLFLKVSFVKTEVELSIESGIESFGGSNRLRNVCQR